MYESKTGEEHIRSQHTKDFAVFMSIYILIYTRNRKSIDNMRIIYGKSSIHSHYKATKINISKWFVCDTSFVNELANTLSRCEVLFYTWLETTAFVIDLTVDLLDVDLRVVKTCKLHYRYIGTIYLYWYIYRFVQMQFIWCLDRYIFALKWINRIR